MIVAGSAELVSGRFRRDRRIHDRDTDMLGHVNNVVWVRFVVELGYAHSEAVGWGQHGYRELGAWWVVYRQQVEYHAAVASP